MNTVLPHLFRISSFFMVHAFALAAEKSPPNVLFIISDDLDCRVGAYGDPVAITPNIDRLAHRGVRFDRAYCQFPLCNPTRASLMTGRYPTTTGVMDNNTLLVLGDGWELVPNWFEQQGYQMAQIAKIYHGPNSGLREGEPLTKAYQSRNWFTPKERAQQAVEEPSYWESHFSPYRHAEFDDPERFKWANEFGPVEETNRGTDAQFATEAIASMQKMAFVNRPFFLAVGFKKPHVPLKAPQKFFDLFKTEQMSLPPDFATRPTIGDNVPVDELRDNIDLYSAREFTAPEAREAIRAYYACVSYMDAQLGRLLDELDRLKIADNTIIIFWGDHGWHLSEKGMWANGTLFESSTRVPMIIVDPRQSQGAGKSSPRCVELVDIYPTLTDICGIESPPGLEGRSLSPLLEDPKTPWDHAAYTLQVRKWSVGRSIRTERWRYTEWEEGSRGSELYDHDADPHEMRNLVHDPKYTATIKSLQKRLRSSPVASSPTETFGN
ncbi:MAG: sulfatase [Pirellulales bacterium]|nr:sulfatase [Pirellulales bacterium]